MRVPRQQTPAPTVANRFRSAPLYAALLATALFSACSSHSWRSSSAMWSDPRHPGGTAEAAVTPSQAEQQQPQPTQSGPAGSDQSAATRSSTGGGDASTAPESPSTAEESHSAPGEQAGTSTQAERTGTQAQTAQGTEAATTGGVSTWESSPAGESAATAQAETAKTGSSGTGTGGPNGMEASGAADTSAMTKQQSAGDTGNGTGLADSSMAGANGATDGHNGPGATAPSDTGGAGSETAANQSQAGKDLSGTGGADQQGTAALSGEAAGSQDNASAAAGGAAVAAAEPARAAGAGQDQTAGAGTADQSSSAAGENLSARPQATPTQPQEVVVGVVEAPGKKATPTETVIPQTLGGMLPLTIGVEGEGEFDFDKAVLREQVRTVLDQLAAKLKTADYDRLEIVGHTDRIGTEVYNQYLSERRAWAVARYLIQQGVPVTKLSVEGRGMQDPVTAAQQCEGLDREQTITCLQRDRRVVISASIRRVDVNVH